MNIAIILSGGVGSRLGENIPKQYIEVKGQPIIKYCLTTFAESPLIDAIVIGVAPEWRRYVEDVADSISTSKSIFYSVPGETRQLTIYNALNKMNAVGFVSDDVVIIHDAARPLVSMKLIEDCIKGCKDNDGVMPVLPVKDTTYLSEDGNRITCLLDRSKLYLGQSPEAFVFGKYLSAHERISTEELLKINGSSELAYIAGMSIGMIQGDPMNFKITTKDDLINFQSIISK